MMIWGERPNRCGGGGPREVWTLGQTFSQYHFLPTSLKVPDHLSWIGGGKSGCVSWGWRQSGPTPALVRHLCLQTSACQLSNVEIVFSIVRNVISVSKVTSPDCTCLVLSNTKRNTRPEYLSGL